MSDAKNAGELFRPWSLDHEFQFLQLTEEEQAAYDARVAADRAKWEEQDRARRYRDKIAKMSRAHGFPVRAIEAAQSADESMPAVSRVAAWDPDDRSVLVLSGKPGCGKTVAATWWAIQQDWSPTFLRASSFAAASRYDKEERSKWLNAGSMVLDDLGTEYADAKGSFLTDLDELIDTLYGNRRSLIITTNLKAEDFRERYGARVVDRIRECGKWESIGGDSLRKAR